MAKQISKLTVMIEVDPSTGAPLSATKRYAVADGDLKKGNRPTPIDTPDFGQTVTAFVGAVHTAVETAEGIS